MNTVRRDPRSWVEQRLPEGAVDYICIAAAALMAIGLHIQPTLTLAGSLVRFSLSDIVALCLVPLALWLVLLNRDLFKRRIIRMGIALFTMGTLVMSYGLVIGANSVGSFTSWALVKYSGWFVLLYYASLGVLLALVGWERVVTIFTRIFVAIHAILIGIFIVTAGLGTAWLAEDGPRLSGFMTNPNAYGLSLLCGMGLLLAGAAQFGERWPRLTWELSCAALVAGILFTRSVGALAGLAVMIFLFLGYKRKVALLLRVFMLSAFIYALPSAGSSVARLAGLNVSADAFGRGIASKIKNPDAYAFSLSARLASNVRAFEKWQEAPWFGSGLGSFLDSERRHAGADAQPQQVHNSALWILTEFGLIGLTVFAIFFVMALTFFFRRMAVFRECDPLRENFLFAASMILMAWATMSLAHEMLYQRLPWFVLGLCAAFALHAKAQIKEFR